MAGQTKHGGRPLKYETAEEMQERIDQYFVECEGELFRDDKRIFTICISRWTIT